MFDEGRWPSPAHTMRPIPTDWDVRDNILQTIGNTPLVRLNRVAAGIGAMVIAKLEYFNPGGSVKDRIGLEMVEDFERRGKLKPGGMVVECTSGNTGVGIALACAIKGYRATFAMPDKMSQKKSGCSRPMAPVSSSRRRPSRLNHPRATTALRAASSRKPQTRCTRTSTTTR